FDHRSIYERQMGLELLEEDHLQAKNEHRGGIHHEWDGSIRRRAFQPPSPQSEKNEPNDKGSKAP
ncbi:MAG: ClC family H(+)/Cl(-) exchange transporter, partial [Propionibacteriaceae bacterium]|nr:ClC family H(+)/Cl(-) exchange transporter [Propionibacteriaceae bacterium]